MTHYVPSPLWCFRQLFNMNSTDLLQFPHCLFKVWNKGLNFGVWTGLAVTCPHYWTVRSSLRRGQHSRFRLRSSRLSQRLTHCTSNLTQGKVLLCGYLVASAKTLEVSSQTWKLSCHPCTWPPAVELRKMFIVPAVLQTFPRGTAKTAVLQFITWQHEF